MAEVRDARLTWAMVIGGVPPMFVALGMTGFFFEIPLWIGIPLVLLGGVVAGLVHGRTLVGRAGFVVAWVIGAFGAFAATVAYCAFRTNLFNVELIIPGFVGGAPGFLVGFLVRRFLEPAP